MKRGDRAEEVFERLAAEQAHALAGALGAAADLARPRTRRALGMADPRPLQRAAARSAAVTRDHPSGAAEDRRS